MNTKKIKAGDYKSQIRNMSISVDEESIDFLNYIRFKFRLKSITQAVNRVINILKENSKYKDEYELMRMDEKISRGDICEK